MLNCNLKKSCRHKAGRSVLALALCAAVAASPVFAAAETTVSASCDEAYYATLDAYGALQEGGVVKSYRLNGASSVIDYGTYDEVINMTDDVKPTVDGGKVTFDLSGESSIPTSFYFEGKTEQPYEDLPWTIKISYRLNGADAKAEDIAGKTGLVEINVDLTAKKSPSDYYNNNLVMVGMAMFNADNIISLEAAGAQVQLLGNLRTVLFLAMPGETQHISIRVGSDSFTCDGLTFVAAPATLSQLSEITELKQSKEKAEDSYQAICDSLDVVLNTMDGMSSSLSEAADGLDELNEARAIVSAQQSQITSSTDAAVSSLSSFSDELQPLISGISGANDAITAAQPQLDTLSANADSVKDDLESTRSAITSMQKDLQQLSALSGELSSASADTKQLIAASQLDLAALTADLKTLRTGLGNLKTTLSAVSASLPAASESKFFAALTASAQPLSGFLTKVRNVNAARAQYEALLQLQPALAGLTFKEFLEQYTDLNQLSAAEAELEAGQAVAVWDLEQEFNGTISLENVLNEAEKLYDTNIPTLTEQAQTVSALHDTVYPAFLKQAGKTEEEVTFKQFLMNYLNAATGETNLSEAEADKAADFWTLMQDYGGTERFEEMLARATAIYKDDLGIDRLQQASTVYASYQEALQQNSSLTFAQFLQLAAQQQGETLSDTEAAAEAEAITQLLELEKKMAANYDSQNSLEAYLTQIQSILDAAKADADDVNQRITDAVNAVDAINSALGTVLTNLDGVTVTLAGSDAKAGLTGDLQNLNALLDGVLTALDGHSADAASAAADLGKLGGAASDTLGDLESMLDTFETLESAMSASVPAAQKSLSGAETALGSAASAAKSAGDAISALESAAKQSSDKLDSGTEKTLSSVAEILRGAAQGLSQTDELRSAKETITSLIESEWNAHTGGEDNILNMDPNASPVSMTSSKNASPKSLQFIIRTQEIKTSSSSAEESTESSSSGGTFWSRVGGIFTGLWNGFVGLFGG